MKRTVLGFFADMPDPRVERTRVLDALTDEALQQEVRGYLETLTPPEGFTMLFKTRHNYSSLISSFNCARAFR